MKEINDGGPAFPVIAEHGLGHISNGMTLRDWFAGQAMIGLLSNPKIDLIDKNIYVDTAIQTYKLADAMIAERGRLGLSR